MAKQTGAKVTGYYALEPVPVRLYGEGYVADRQMVAEFERRARASAKKQVDAIARAAAKAGVRCDTLVETARTPYEGIIEAARKRRCDLILMASHGYRGPDAPDARQRHRQGHPALEDPGAGVPLGGCSSKPKRRSSSFSASSRNMKTAPQAITTVPSRKASGRVANQYCMIGA